MRHKINLKTNVIIGFKERLLLLFGRKMVITSVVLLEKHPGDIDANTKIRLLGKNEPDYTEQVQRCEGKEVQSRNNKRIIETPEFNPQNGGQSFSRN
jgi:hypothetical protein